VRAGTNYDANDSRTGTLDVSGGTPTFPPVSDVRLGIEYGPESNPSQFVGNVRVPPPDQVADGYLYDTADSVEGTLDVGTIPDVDDVRFGAAVGQGETGTLIVPIPGDVKQGVAYDSNGSLVGTYDCIASNDPGDPGWVG
jgi:hypothetical protein